MKKVWFTRIAVVLIALPLSSALYQVVIGGAITPQRLLSRLNAVPLPFVLSSPNYFRTAQVTQVFEDETQKELASPRSLFKTRLDKTVFDHLIRLVEHLPRPYVRTLYRRAFCADADGNSKVRSFRVSVTSRDAGVVSMEQIPCK